jgi:hypothetical protein
LITRPESNFGRRSILGKILELAQTWIKGATENEDYGNAQILREYCSVNRNRKIRGRIQHGWIFYDESANYYKNDYARSFVWNSKAVDWSISKGYSRFVAIGAPWLYLLELLKRDGWETTVKPTSERFIEELWVFGNHGVTADTVQGKTFLNFLLKFQESVAENKLLILYYRDFDYLKVNFPELTLNLPIVTVGQRTNSASSTAHLFRLWHLLSQTKKFVTEFPTTMSVYAMTLKCKTLFIEGEELDNVITKCENLSETLLVDLFQNKDLDLNLVSEFAYKSLGKDSLMNPVELSRTLGWSK